MIEVVLGRQNFVVGIVIARYYRHIAPLPGLFAAVALGLYPLVKKGSLDLVRERKLGTELFVTVATAIAMLGREYVAGGASWGPFLTDREATLRLSRAPCGALHDGRHQSAVQQSRVRVSGPP